MKRGVVMEVKRKKAVILTENGQFETIRLPKKGERPRIGDSVSMAGEGIGYVRKGHSVRWLPAISMITVLLIFIVLLGGLFPSYPDKTVAAYVSYDVNPSFSAAVNGELQVVSVKTWNQDAARLFSNWNSYAFMGLKDFSHQVIQKFAEQGYFDGQPQVLIASTVVVPNQKKHDKLKTSLEKVINGIRSDDVLAAHHVVVAVKTADPKVRQNANAQGLSLGRYLLYQDAENSGMPLSISKIKQMSVSDIEQKMKTRKSDNPGNSKSLQTLNKTQSDHEVNGSLQSTASQGLEKTPASSQEHHEKLLKNTENNANPKKTSGKTQKKEQDQLKKPKPDKKDHGEKGNHPKNKHHRKNKGNSSGKSRPNPHRPKTKPVKSKHPGKSEHHNHKGHKEHQKPSRPHEHGKQQNDRKKHWSKMKMKRKWDLSRFDRIFDLKHGILHIHIGIDRKAE